MAEAEPTTEALTRDVTENQDKYIVRLTDECPLGAGKPKTQIVGWGSATNSPLFETLASKPRRTHHTKMSSEADVLETRMVAKKASRQCLYLLRWRICNDTKTIGMRFNTAIWYKTAV